MAEDAVTVLEDFIQDVANLPAEMAHLFEEIQAKDKLMQDCRNTIADRDNALQKFIRQNGSLVVNPKEDEYAATITSNFDRAQALQEEKIALSDKAGVLLDRQVRRLDIKLRELARQDKALKDSPLPSILNVSSADGIFSDLSTPNTGMSTPLNPMAGNGPAGVTIANSALSRLAHPQPSSNRGDGQLLMPNQGGRSGLSAGYMASSAPATPAAGLQLHQRQQRESSAGAVGTHDVKRRRLAHLGNLPATSSALARHSSLGPSGGTPRAGTPSSVRSGSAGPNKRSSGSQAGSGSNKNPSAAQQQIRRKLARPGQLAGGGNSSNSNGPRKSSSVSSSGNRKGTTTTTSTSTTNNGISNLGTTDHDNSRENNKDRKIQTDGGNDSNSDPDRSHQRPLHHRRNGNNNNLDSDSDVDDEELMEGNEDEEMIDPDSDDKKYCTCRNISHGNMVACDNDDCPYEWFHWQCVGMTKEPIGKWYCPDCRVKLGLVTNAG